MKSFLSKTSASLCTSFILLSIFLITAITQLTNPTFIKRVLNDSGFYPKVQLAIRYSVQNQVEAQIQSQGIDLETLSVGERKALDDEIGAMVSKITVDVIKNFSETNIDRVYDYLSGKNDKLLFYAPVEEWGIYENIDEMSTPKALTESIDINKMISDNPDTVNIKKVISFFYNLEFKLNILLLISIALSFVFLIINYTTSRKQVKIFSTAKILIVSGGLTIFWSIFLRYLGQNIIRSSPYIRDPKQVILGSMLPAFVNEVTKLWVISGLSLAIAGIILFIIATYTLQAKRKKQLSQKKEDEFIPT